MRPGVRLRRASSPSSRPTRTGTARQQWGSRSRRPGRPCWPVPTSRRASPFARRACGSPILVFGALSVSDLDAVFDYQLTPTVSTPAAARALALKAAERGVPARVPSQNGHGDESARVPARQPASHDAGCARRVRICGSRPSTRILRRPMSQSLAFSTSSAQRFERAVAALGALGLRGVPRHAANSAALLRDARTWYDWVRPGLLLYGIVPPPLASELPLRPGLSLTSRIVAVKGVRVWRRRRVRPALARRGASDHRDRAGRLRRWPRHTPGGPRGRAGARHARARRRRRVHGHDHGRRHRPRRGSRRRGRHHRPAGRCGDHGA